MAVPFDQIYSKKIEDKDNHILNLHWKCSDQSSRTLNAIVIYHRIIRYEICLHKNALFSCKNDDLLFKHLILSICNSTEMREKRNGNANVTFISCLHSHYVSLLDFSFYYIALSPIND